MADITSLSDEHWALTDDVQDLIDIPDKGNQRDFERPIERATNTVQSWFKTAVGQTELPDAGSLDDLLQEATAWYAVSEVSFTYSRNFDTDQGSGRTSNAEQRARDKFEQWDAEREVGSGEVHDEDEVTDTKAKSGALIDEV